MEERDWRWANFPIPEAHLTIGGVAVVFGLLWPLSLGLDDPWAWIAGLVLGGVGVTMMIWATATAGRIRLVDPDQLVTDGAYRFCRHPMYLGWTLVYLALMFVLNSAWLLFLLPFLVIWVHWESGREERQMVDKFGDRYVDYQGRVRRYL